MRLLRDRVPGEIGTAGGTLTSTNGDTVVDFPAAAFTEPMTGTYRLLLTDQNTGTRAGIGRTFEVTAVQADLGEPGPPTLGQPVTIEITYTDAEITSGAVDEASSGTLSLGWHQLAARAQQPHRPSDEPPHGHTRSSGAFCRIGRYPSISVP